MHEAVHAFLMRTLLTFESISRLHFKVDRAVRWGVGRGGDSEASGHLKKIVVHVVSSRVGKITHTHAHTHKIKLSLTHHALPLFLKKTWQERRDNRE